MIKTRGYVTIPSRTYQNLPEMPPTSPTAHIGTVYKEEGTNLTIKLHGYSRTTFVRVDKSLFFPEALPQCYKRAVEKAQTIQQDEVHFLSHPEIVDLGFYGDSSKKVGG